MGMSSSQARLLNLTSRMHQIEYKAAKLEAEKLQMANESRRAYEDYLFVKEQTSVQVGLLAADGSRTYVNTTLAMLEGRTDYKIAKPLYLQDVESGKIMVSKATQDKYNLGNSGVVGDLQSFMNNAGLSKSVVQYAYLPNTVQPAQYTPVSTEVIANSKRVVPNIDPSVGYHAVAHQSTVGMTPISTVSDFTVGQTYVINSADDLKKLQDMTNSGKSTQGVNFVLGANIDMSGITWTGIGNSAANAFKGTFDGNGYTISNLTGTNAGLFKNIIGNRTSSSEATYGIVKNVKVTGLNITGTGVGEKGGIAGIAQNAYIENCYTEGSIQGANWSAGMIGHNKGSAVINSTANVNVSTSGTCVGGFIGHDSSGYLVNCVSYGSVSGSGYVGGLIGHEQSNGQGRIEKCSTLSTVTSSNNSTKGAFIGVIDSGCSVNVINSSYSSSAGSPCGSAPANAFQSTGSEAGLSGTATREVTTTKINVPSKVTFASNVAMMLEKSGTTVDADFNAKLMTWLDQFYQIDDNFTDGALVKDSLKLASINDTIADYLRTGSNPAVVNALISDINNNSLTATSGYQNKYVETKDYEYSPFASTSAAQASKQFPVNTPSLENISNNLYTALHQGGFPNAEFASDVADVLAWVRTNYNNGNSEADKLALANLNAYLETLNSNPGADKTELTKINTAILNNGRYTMPAATQTYKADASTNTSYYVNSMTHNNAQAKTEEYNMNLPEIAEAVNLHAILQANGYIVIDEPQASSNEWLTNTINSGRAILIETGTTKVESFETSVSTNTMLQEVENKTKLKRAEAEYEAAMLKIDRKDRKYDTDLAALDAERNAIKQEMETLKTVAKENVERTFKLFS